MNEKEHTLLKEYCIQYYEYEERSKERNKLVNELATKLGIHPDAARKRINNLGRTLKHPQPPKKKQQTSNKSIKIQQIKKILPKSGRH